MANSLDTLLFTVMQNDAARQRQSAEEQVRGAQAIQAATQDVTSFKEKQKAEAQEVGGASKWTGAPTPEYENPELTEAAGRGALFAQAQQAGQVPKMTLEEHLQAMKGRSALEVENIRAKAAVDVGGGHDLARAYAAEQALKAHKEATRAREKTLLQLMAPHELQGAIQTQIAKAREKHATLDAYTRNAPWDTTSPQYTTLKGAVDEEDSRLGDMSSVMWTQPGLPGHGSLPGSTRPPGTPPPATPVTNPLELTPIPGSAPAGGDIFEQAFPKPKR